MQYIRSTVNRVRGLPSKASEQIEVLLELTKSMIYYTVVISLTLNLLGTVSVFMYGTFYFAFVPAPQHEGAIHPTFVPCERVMGKCGFLNATVELSERNPVLMTGQPYTIMIQLEMPESPVNRRLGMFMNCLKMRSRDGIFRKENCKASLMQYRSELLRVLETFVFAPVLLTGHSTEKQWVTVEFFNNFLDDPLSPVVGMNYEIQSRFIEVYNIRYRIYANFSGLRYLMFNYPLISAFIGSSLNMMFLSAIILLSWYRFFSPKLKDEDNFYANNEHQEDFFESPMEEYEPEQKATLLNEGDTEDEKVSEGGSSVEDLKKEMDQIFRDDERLKSARLEDAESD